MGGWGIRYLVQVEVRSWDEDKLSSPLGFGRDGVERESRRLVFIPPLLPHYAAHTSKGDTSLTFGLVIFRGRSRVR